MRVSDLAHNIYAAKVFRTVVSSSPTSFFNAALSRNRFTFQRHKIKKQNLPSPSEWSERFGLESGDTPHSKTPKDTSTRFQIFMILQCNISSQHKTKSSPTAIAQRTRDCTANQSYLSNGVVQLTPRYKQIFLPPLKFIFLQRKNFYVRLFLESTNKSVVTSP